MIESLSSSDMEELACVKDQSQYEYVKFSSILNLQGQIKLKLM
jgi:hypothetical protein